MLAAVKCKLAYATAKTGTQSDTGLPQHGKVHQHRISLSGCKLATQSDLLLSRSADAEQHLSLDMQWFLLSCSAAYWVGRTGSPGYILHAGAHQRGPVKVDWPVVPVTGYPGCLPQNPDLQVFCCAVALHTGRAGPAALATSTRWGASAAASRSSRWPATRSRWRGSQPLSATSPSLAVRFQS